MQREASRCPECDAEFLEHHELESHVKQIHNKTLPQAFVCPSCGEEFGTIEALNTHGKFEHFGAR